MKISSGVTIPKKIKAIASPKLEHHETDNIRKRLVTFKYELFVFLKYPAKPLLKKILFK